MSRVIADGLSKRGQFESVGQFGLGTTGAPVYPFNDLNELAPTGFYSVYRDGVANGVPATDDLYYLVDQHVRSFTSTSSYKVIQKAYGRNGTTYTRGLDKDGVWSNWQLVYNQSNILGTVSQSAGVPTGAIIERGSNANGEYTKFADGTLICRKSGAVYSNLVATAYEAGWATGLTDIAWYFPVDFIASPTVSFQGRVIGSGSSRRSGTLEVYVIETTRVRGWAYASSDFDEVTSTQFMAIGRWW